MFVRNLLQAGDFVTIIPSGVRITLQYSERGSLECIYTGHKDDKVLHPELLTPILKSGDVPTHLPITKGTSFVYGVLYTGQVYEVEGKLQGYVESNYLSEYLKDPSKFHFFAGHMQSYAIGMNSPMSIQRWMKTVGFNILPSYNVPANLREDNFTVMLNLDNYPFKYPRIQGYILFRKGKFDFVSTNLRQIVVTKIEKNVIYEGYILANIHSQDSGVIVSSYSDVVNMNIHEKSILLVDEDSRIIDCINLRSELAPNYARKLTCEYCGRLINVPKDSRRFTCEDEHCASVMLQKVNRMLKKLGLDTIEPDAFFEFSKKQGNIVQISDIFYMDKYKDVKLTVDIPKLLDAVVPSYVIPRFSDWSVFCNKCNNSVESIRYYLENPEKMMFDLNLDGAIYKKLYDWLLSPENLLDITGMMDLENINIISTGKRFEGAPIFRGKSIYVTGKFKHGDFNTVHAILTSYSALVYDRFNTAVDCVIIGSLHDGVDGKSVQKAKQFSIPIFEEDEFFAQYDIDTDLSSATM